jgi:hypothetical protein
MTDARDEPDAGVDHHTAKLNGIKLHWVTAGGNLRARGRGCPANSLANPPLNGLHSDGAP